MEKTKIVLKKRKFKRSSNRKLTLRDLAVLDFLWTWKVATTPMLKEIGYKNKSNWLVYKALRQLKNEKFIQSLPRGKHLDLELWALTEAGFEIVLMDRDDIAHYRYKPHAPTHDFLATCLQLGEYWQSDVDYIHFTEQMLASLSPSNFPKSIRGTSEHIPDGITVFHCGNKSITVGYEVDLNLKEDERYKTTSHYYSGHGANADLIVWLVKNKWIADKIQALLKSEIHDYKISLNKFAFILLDDFKQNLWQAKTINGNLSGISISKLHANLLQSVGKLPPKMIQKSFQNIFFPIHKSPQKLNTYKTEALHEIN